jgi:hypothetical protein
MTDLEPIYDEQIAPLMTEIIRICKEHQLPMLATFQLNDGDEADDGPLLCTSTLLPDGCDNRLLNAKRVIYNGWNAVPSLMAMTIRKESAA